MANLTLYDPSVGAVFKVPAASWRLIDVRVGATRILLQYPSQQSLGAVIPNLGRLFDVALNWPGTRQGLAEASQQIAQFATQATENMTKALQQLAGADQTQPVPAPLADMIRQMCHAIGNAGSSIAMNASDLDTQLQKFFDAFQALDQTAQNALPQLGALPNYAGFLPTLALVQATVGPGFGMAAGAWNAIVADLRSIACGVNLNWNLLARLDLEAAIQGWSTVQAEATAFAANMPGNEDNLVNGSWVANAVPPTPVLTAMNDPMALFGQYLMLTCGFPQCGMGIPFQFPQPSN